MKLKFEKLEKDNLNIRVSYLNYFFMLKFSFIQMQIIYWKKQKII
jgi:hypothetical protein